LDWDTGQAEALRFAALLSLVNDHESLRRGELSEFGNDDVIAFTRKLGNEAFTVLVNLRKTPTSILLPDGNQSSIALGAYEVRITPSN
jgi:glycosidase